MEIMKPSLEEYFELPNPGLRAYFKRTVDGNPDDYRPPFWKGEPRSHVLRKWRAVIDQTDLARALPSLYKYEMDMSEKVGPMSYQLPLRERLRDVENYFTMANTPSEPLMAAAIASAVKFFSPAGGIRKRSIDKTVDNMRLNTNSGNPWFTKRKLIVDEAKQSEVYKDSKGTWFVRTPKHTYKLCSVLGWRGQEGGLSVDDVKQRVIWMMSIALNIAELQIYQPAIEAIQKKNLIPAYVSMDAVDDEVTALFRSKGANDVVICTDFTKFDQHFNLHMQNAALAIELALLGDEETRRHHNSIYNAKFELPLICSENLMYAGKHGMGSGSGGTNFDECMAHKALQFESAIRNSQRLNPHSMAYGDDGILTYPGINVIQVIETYSRHGQEMNPTKQYVSKHDCVVLRRWHGTEYVRNGRMVGVYSTFRALGRLLAQEKFYDPEQWSAEMVTLRALSIIENCKWSPLFEKFIDFVIKGDRFRLGLDLPGFLENLSKIAQRSIDNYQDFLGYTKTQQQHGRGVEGINDWEVVKYLRKLK